MKTVSELTNLVGREGFLQLDDLRFQIKVLDVRQVWDRTDLFIEPVSGTGTKWVSRTRVELV